MVSEDAEEQASLKLVKPPVTRSPSSTYVSPALYKIQHKKPHNHMKENGKKIQNQLIVEKNTQ